MSILAPDREPASRYPPAGRALPPLPPRWAHRAARARRPGDVPLWRFVFLSMLLHALAILMFGAPSGGSREGRAMWGSLDVVIRDSFQDAAPTLRLDRLLPLPAPAPATRMAPPPAAPVVEPPKAEAPSVAVPPMLDRLERPPEAPEFTVPKAAESAPQAERRIQPAPLQATPLEPLPAPAPQRQLAEPPKIEAPLEAPKPIEAPAIDRILAPRIERQLAEPPKIEAPLVQPLPAIEAQPMDRIVAPRVERQLAEPPRVEAPLVQPVETPALPAPRAQPAPAPSVPAPRPAETLPPQELSPAPPVAPAVPERPAPAAPAPASPRELPDGRRESVPAEPAPSPFRAAPARPADSPAPTYDPTKPALDMDALRKRAGDLTRQGTGNRAVLPFPMPPVDKPKSKMEQAIENARKPDCRTAYKELGLAAVVPLIANEFGEGHCRW